VIFLQKKIYRKNSSHDIGKIDYSKGKTPWITFNGVEVADSQLAIEYLCRHLNINMNKHLNKEEVAISRCKFHHLNAHFVPIF
jgi:hypothetical protein